MESGIKEYIAGYLQEQISKGVSTREAGHKKNRLKKLKEYLDEEGIGFKYLRSKKAQRFQGWLLKKKSNKGHKYAKSTVVRAVNQASSFYEYLKKNKVILSNPLKQVKRVRVDKTVVKNILKEKQMNKLLDELTRFEDEQSLREKVSRYKLHVVAEIMYATGMRIGEAEGLRVEDIDFERGMVVVKDKKKKKQRIAILNEYAIKVLKLYVEKMRYWVFCKVNFENGTLFGTKGESLECFLNKKLKYLCKRLGYSIMTTHGFRHSLGYHLLKAGCDIRYIQSILGHERLRTTQIYTRVEKEELRSVLDKYHPRKWAEKDGT